MFLSKSKQETKVRAQLLDAAEAVFNEYGFDGASMRKITQKANIVLSLAYYYYPSKEELLKAVFFRLLEPILKSQRKELDIFCEKNLTGEKALEELIRIFLLPPLNYREDKEPRMGLFGRVFSLNGELQKKMVNLLVEITQDVNNIFEREFCRVFPNISKTDLQFYILFMHSFIVGYQRLFNLSKDKFSSISLEEQFNLMFQFFKGGLLNIIKNKEKESC